MKKGLGIHYLAELFGCDKSKIDDLALVEEAMIEATTLSGARMIRPFFHRFNPQGITGVIVIAESHFAVHTWPEHGYAAVDLFSCSALNYRGALNHLRLQFGAARHSVSLIERGILDGDFRKRRGGLKQVDIGT
ncbi:MAG: adenosylmethionine decarboxylase [Spirochaetes bacterium]|nr:adenosylmethionine decarboxylase [Spirochaetota bacterium]